MSNVIPFPGYNGADALRIMAYSHDSFGLGHFRRILAVARAATRLDERVEILCVTGSPRPEVFDLPARVDYVKIPAITKNADGVYIPRDLPSSISHVVNIRSETILSLSRSFAPHVMLVDHTAMGVHSELLATLGDLRDRTTPAKVLLGMRDIVDSPDRVVEQFSRSRFAEVVDRFYDKVLVYGHQDFFDIGVEYQLPAGFREKTEYVGYACSFSDGHKPAGTRPLDETTAVRLLATAGGGEDGVEVLRGFVGAVEAMNDVPVESATIVGGPMLPKAHLEDLQDMTREDDRFQIIPSTSDLPGLLAKSDLIVGMGGYNSITEALCMDKRMVVVPRCHPRREQLERARRMGGAKLLHWVHPDDAAEPDRLAHAMRSALRHGTPRARERGFSFEGPARAAEIIVSLAEEATREHLIRRAAPWPS